LHELSGGEKQKVAIASVLALHPEILVLDEPTSELDPNSAEEVLLTLERLNGELGITVILVEQRLDRVVQHVDRVLILDKGTMVADGPVRDVLAQGYDRLTGIGIGIPPIIRLTHELHKMGIDMAEIPLTVKEGRISLGEVLKKAAGHKVESNENRKGCLRPVVEVEKLWYAYPEGNTALRGVSLRIGEGEFVAIMGRNASGKTTLLKHFNGLLKPTRGNVLVDGVNTGEATVAQLARKVGFLFQNPNDHLFADTVEEEIGFTVENLGFERKQIGSRVDEMLRRFNLEGYRRQYPRALSGGEKQRVALASVIAAEPKVLVLDEPTRGMDHRLKTELMDFLHEYSAQGNTVILVTHDVEIVAEYAERVVLLSEGNIVVDGHKQDVLSRALLFSPQINRLVQAFERYGLPGNILTVDELVQMLK
jgi:energy-coupling factor transporter ATP-binding protein EcfA2